jgi:2-dehydropantoate 2-reductase
MVYCFKLYAFIAKPYLATDNPSEIGIADYLIICTKTYDLESTIKQLQPCINKDTIILPLLNGVDNREKIKSLLPHNMVLDGCVYIVSRLKAPAIIENSGNIQTLYFGLDNFVNEKLLLLESLFKQACIEATLSQTISAIIWEKFIFISPTATATSYFNNSVGELHLDTEKRKFISLLIEEVKQIANAKQIKVADDITEKVLNKLKALPFETTSSMHSDFQSNKANNELESLTAYVIQEGIKYNVATPTYKTSYEKLLWLCLTLFVNYKRL